jgi:aminopeptidase N
MQKASLLFVILFFKFFLFYGQAEPDLQKNIDIQKYVYHIAVNDSTDVIEVKADITVLFNEPVKSFSLDLVSRGADGKGMFVDEVSENKERTEFTQSEEKLLINTDIKVSFLQKTFTVKYHGIPKDGLIIGKNKFGDRTFFGDNWPNRAHNWLACVDHPLDKALVEFHVISPAYYQVIASGKFKEKTNLNNDLTLSVWKTEVPLPTKVMVIGVARFAVEQAGETNGIPISTWVYPQNKKEGFYDYAPAVEMVDYFIDKVGPFPFSKLANVQSKTRFGGMENAGNIFYFERSVTGQRKHESLLVHEIAHQWFGDSATETDWKHLWLSEGFATYFTNLYYEDKYGKERFQKRMADQREKVIRFSKNHKTAVIDTVTTSLLKLLNANSYEKGSWVLHMLRKEVGEDVFWQAIRSYYKKYTYKNASTNDLKQIFEEVSGKELDDFFKQWLEKPGHPVLKTSYVQNGKTIMINVEQVQNDDPVFKFPLEVKLIYTGGTSEIIRIKITKKKEVFSLKVREEVKDILIDPDVWLLFEKR